MKEDVTSVQQDSGSIGAEKYALQEGAESWKQEYDDCRAILFKLVALKKMKDTKGKTEAYLERQPLAWEEAKLFLSKYQHL